jgi:hypothetical protein
MATLQDIFNVALYRVAHEPLVDPTDMDSERGRACNLIYPVVRQSLLVTYDWSFARMLKKLAALSETSDYFSFVYAFPSNCLRTRKMVGVSAKQPWVITSLGIETNIESAIMRYTIDQQSIGRYSAKFVEALGLAIALKVAPKLAGLSTSRIREIRVEAFQALAEAQQIDASSDNDGPLEGSDPSQDSFVTGENSMFGPSVNPYPWLEPNY